VPTTSLQKPQFSAESDAIAGRLRETFSSIISTICGGSPRAQDVTDGFAIHRKLGWQIWNVAYGEDPLAPLRFMPYPRGIDVWTRAAEQRGVPAEMLASLRAAVDEFQRLISTHAEDREMFEIMLEGAATGDGRTDESVDVRYRKQAFTGNSFIWGVRAKSILASMLLAPSQRDGKFDMVRLHGLFDLIRTRSTVRWPFAQSIVKGKDGTQHKPLRQPLSISPAVKALGVPLLDAFCSQPLPPVERRTSESGMVEDELLPGPVGQTGASTVITGEIWREVAPIKPSRKGEVALFGTGVRTPGEVLVSDHFVHREMFPGVTRELRVFGELISNTTQDERDVLPTPERIVSLGRGLERVRTAEIPRYADMLALAFERAGWNPSDFDVFRIRMRYPPIPISVMVRLELL
jgi:hypothetical protein